MESDLQQPNSSGLTRYRSAPSSYFNNIIDREFYEHIFNKPSSPETERVFSRFMNSLRDDGAPEDSLAQNFSAGSAVKEENISLQDQGIPSINNNEQVVLQQQQQNNMNNYSTESHGFNYQSTARPPLPNQNLNSGMEGGGGGRYSLGVNQLPQMKTGGGNHSTLARHNSSPAGLFSQITIENGYVGMRGMGTIGAVNNTIEEAKFSTGSGRRLKNNIHPQSYSSRGLMSSIAEIGGKDNREGNQEGEAFGENSDYVTDFPPWDDSVAMNDNNVAGLKRFTSDDARSFSGLNAAETQNETRGQGPAPAPLAHHLSLPNTSAEMAAIEKFLHFSDSVPCKIRAKRGCATHPRSIAERVRRTKISERMRKLQDLVPNMDKQTNTADMLDLAVDYIKDLQKQVQSLSDCHAKCKCSPNPQQ